MALGKPLNAFELSQGGTLSVNLPPKPITDSFPPFVFEKNFNRDEVNITKIGQLWIRLYNWIIKEQQQERHYVFSEGPRNSKFDIGKLGVVEVLEGKRPTGEDAMVVVVIIDKTPALLYDDVNLFPSDGLMAQLMVLKDGNLDKLPR